MDPLGQSQQVPAVPELPEFKEHERQVRRLWKQCVAIAGLVFLVTGATTAVMFHQGMNPATVVALSTTIFQVLLLSYGMGFFVPAFLTSLKRLHLSVQMMYVSLDMGRQTVDAMKEMRDKANPLFKDARELVDQVTPAAKRLDAAAVERLEGYMKDIRDRIVRDTQPLKVNRRDPEGVGATGGDGHARQD